MTSMRTRGRLVERLRSHGINNSAVLDAIYDIPRHLFVDEALSSRAYEDTALPIGHQQTISQPWVVARMTELLLAPKVPGRVLEIGTGCGYQTAVLSRLCRKIYTIERIADLQRQAANLLYDLHCRNIEFRHGDGNDGWPEEAPFDAIIVTAGCAEVPQALVRQLAVGGRIVAPAGNGVQNITIIDRDRDGVSHDAREEVTFVPLLRGTV